MELHDGPGCNSKEDIYQHSWILKAGLTCEPLNAIFIAVGYDPRIKDNMGGDFEEVTKILKKEYLDHVVLLVTKMDLFKPDQLFPSRAAVENGIR